MTYSIVARDPETGRLGVAVQSHWFSVGSVVSWGEAGVGVVATQSFAERSYGPLGLELMRRGRSAPEALEMLVRADEYESSRQVAFVDREGGVAVHSGADCIREFGHNIGNAFSVQANMMERDTVWDAMADAYRAADGDLPDRMLAALTAGQAEGGDIRGMQSAAILVVASEPTGTEWDDRVLDLRVEDHPMPVDELARLVRLWRAYGHAEAAEQLELDEDRGRALDERLASLEVQPGHPELSFWAAVALAQAGRAHEAQQAAAVAHGHGRGWAELLRRVVADGQVELTPDQLGLLLEPPDS